MNQPNILGSSVGSHSTYLFVEIFHEIGESYRKSRLNIDKDNYFLVLKIIMIPSYGSYVLI